MAIDLKTALVRLKDFIEKENSRFDDTGMDSSATDCLTTGLSILSYPSVSD